MNKEHVWPDWVRKIILAERGAPGKTFRVEHEKRGVVTRFRSADLETTVSMPCKKCNEGWMHDLENAVRPFMAAMVHPGDTIFLDANRRRLLARWATKTAMVFEFVRERERHYFTPAARREFMNSSLPALNLSVWLGRYWAMKPMHGLQHRKEGDTSGTIALYTLTLTAQFFAMQVAARDGMSAKVPVARLPEGALIQIWPGKFAPHEFVRWPPARTMGERGLNALDTRFRGSEMRPISAADFET